MLTDEAAARAAEQAGGGGVVLRRQPIIHCMEPASFRFGDDGSVSGRVIQCPGVYSQERCWRRGPYRLWGAPRCRNCGKPAVWRGPPVRRRSLWVYPLGGDPSTERHRVADNVYCTCRPRAWMASHFRLVVGGSCAWWWDRGWRLSVCD